MRIATRMTGAALGLLLLASGALAQDSGEDKLEKKLSKEFVQNAAWETDYDAALAKATASGKLIFAYFTRSYSP